MPIKFPQISLKNVHGILIDLDNTIYDFINAEEHALKACHLAYCKDFEKIKWQEFLSQYYMTRMAINLRLAPQAACRSRFLAFQHWLETHDVEHAHIYARNYEQLYWQVFLDNIKIAVDADKFITKVIKQSLPIAVVTNMQPQIQLAKLEKLGIAEKIDFLVTSEEAGAEKPSPFPFKLALEKMQLTPEHVIMVGDNPKHDILGAEALGIKSYLVKADKNNF